MFPLFSSERELSEATEELSPAVLHLTSTKKKKGNCFPRENVLREVTKYNRKKPRIVVSVTSGCVKAALRLLFVLLFFSFFVDVDCKKGENSTVANAPLPYPLSEKIRTLLIQIPLNSC